MFGPNEAGVQKTQPFSRIQSPPKTSFYPCCRNHPMKQGCRGIAPDGVRDPSRKTSVNPSAAADEKAGVQRTQFFAGVRGVPENPFYLSCHRRWPFNKIPQVNPV